MTRQVLLTLSALLLLPTACSPSSPHHPPFSPQSGSVRSNPAVVDGGREELYSYCDTATGQDPRCWSSRFGNDLRALEESLRGLDQYGGQTQTDVDAPYGLTSATPVGAEVGSVGSSVHGIGLGLVSSAGACRYEHDNTAALGVVTLSSQGPRGDVAGIQAFVIDNPVFRVGRPLSDAAAGLGAPGIGTGSSLAELRATYPGLEVVDTADGKVAMSPATEAREMLLTESSQRATVFLLGDDDRVVRWLFGVPEYALRLCG